MSADLPETPAEQLVGQLEDAGDVRLPAAQEPISAKIPSPEATGGAGGTVESRVTAIVLARLLRGDRVPGLALAPERVRLQQLVTGALLDDIVIDATDQAGAGRTIEYQSKRQLSPGKGNADFVDVIKRCLQAVAADAQGSTDVDGHGAGAVAAGRRRFGIVSHPSVALADLARVTDIARSHDTADSFVEVVGKTARQGVGQRYKQLKETVEHILRQDVTELDAGPTDKEIVDAVWRVASVLHVWQIDAEPDGTDLLAAQDRLADLLPEGSDPAEVFLRLVTLAQEWAPQAGSISLDMLRVRLENDGLALDAQPARRQAFETARAATGDLLNPQAARLGQRLSLARPALRRQVIDAFAEHDHVLLTGRAGVGKSILARLVGGDLVDDGDVVLALNLSGRTGGLAGLHEELGARLIDSFAGAPIGHRRILLLDGAEQALTDSGALLNAVLAAVPTDRGSAPPWQVLVVARDEAAPAVAEFLQLRTGTAPHRLHVAELEDDEVEEILVAFPELSPIGRNPRARALLLRRPYLVELLVRGVATAGLPPDIVGEEDLLDLVYSRLVRRAEGALPGRGLPDARADIFTALAAAAVNNTLPTRLDGADADARPGLASDDVIVRIGLSWQFSHDILTDYAVAIRLLEGDGDDLLSAAPAPRRLLRAARLRMQRQLSDALTAGNLTAAWTATLQQADVVAAADGPRWAELPWEALLHLGPSRTALDALKGELLKQDGAGLLTLLDVTGRLARKTPAPASEPLAALLGMPLDVPLSAPVVDLLAELADDIPNRARPSAAQLVHAHLEAVWSTGGEVDEHLKSAAALPDALLGWTGEDTYGDVHDLALGSLAMLGRHLQPEHEQWLIDRAKADPHRVSEAVESPWAASALARERPGLLLRLAGLYYLGVGLRIEGPPLDIGERPRSRDGHGSPFDLDDQPPPDPGALRDVRDHDSRQSRPVPSFLLGQLGDNLANPALGPFAALLRADPQRGLHLIGAVVDAATSARAAVEAEGTLSAEAPNASVELEIQGTARVFTGPESVWRWYRRTSVGPYPAMSAAMALRAWAIEQIRREESLEAVRDAILLAGTSLALPAVALSVLVEAIDDVQEEIDPFLSQPLVWHLEVGRVVGESGGAALQVPGAPRLRWTVSDVAMRLVLRGDAERRQRLAQLAAVLRSNAPSSADGSDGVVHRWACELDIGYYRRAEHEDGVVVYVEYPDEIVTALAESGGTRAARSLERASLTFRATQLRDEPRADSEAELVWQQVKAHCAAGDLTPLRHASELPEMVLAAASALVTAAAAGAAVPDEDLREATTELLKAAAAIASWAPPPREESPEEAEGRTGVVYEELWDQGSDRSAASALPLLLVDDALRERAGVDAVTLSEAHVAVAASPFDETRVRLVRGLEAAAAEACEGDCWKHTVVVAVARQLLATAGYGQLTRGYGYAPATLPEPLETTLAEADGPAIELGGAASAVDLLHSVNHARCEHGESARRLLEALVAYDGRVWVKEYARRHYSRTAYWRAAVDAYIADWVLAGDTDALLARMEAFAGVQEELTSLLTALADRAVRSDLLVRLHELWPAVLDRLLPEHRSIGGIPHEGRRPHEAFPSDIDELDDALLLTPPMEATTWPVEAALALGKRWVEAFLGRADRIDRVVLFASRLLGVNRDSAELVVAVAGDDVRTLSRSSRYLVTYLKLSLKDVEVHPLTGQLRVLLDRLAAAGNEAALRLQQDLELGQ